MSGFLSMVEMFNRFCGAIIFWFSGIRSFVVGNIRTAVLNSKQDWSMDGCGMDGWATYLSDDPAGVSAITYTRSSEEAAAATTAAEEVEAEGRI